MGTEGIMWQQRSWILPTPSELHAKVNTQKSWVFLQFCWKQRIGNHQHCRRKDLYPVKEALTFQTTYFDVYILSHALQSDWLWGKMFSSVRREKGIFSGRWILGKSTVGRGGSENWSPKTNSLERSGRLLGVRLAHFKNYWPWGLKFSFYLTVS